MIIILSLGFVVNALLYFCHGLSKAILTTTALRRNNNSGGDMGYPA
jgi:hypothetical protein